MYTPVNPCKPQIYYIKVGFNGVKIIYACFHDDMSNENSDQNKKKKNKNFYRKNSFFDGKFVSIYLNSHVNACQIRSWPYKWNP